MLRTQNKPALVQKYCGKVWNEINKIQSDCITIMTIVYGIKIVLSKIKIEFNKTVM